MLAGTLQLLEEPCAVELNAERSCQATLVGKEPQVQQSGLATAASGCSTCTSAGYILTHDCFTAARLLRCTSTRQNTTFARFVSSSLLYLTLRIEASQALSSSAWLDLLIGQVGIVLMLCVLSPMHNSIILRLQNDEALQALPARMVSIDGYTRYHTPALA